ncbi:MAG: hypothetical protein J6S14_01595 [Clostridia bacterium]|nr:hypothetical protein [Clostridia bacterium]
MKKLMSLFVAFAMLFALCVPASAAEAGHPYPWLCDCNDGSLVYDGTYFALQDWSDDSSHYYLEYDAYYCTVCEGYSYEYVREVPETHYDVDDDGFCDACGY